MYRCQQCGTEFEGNFCPECGAAKPKDCACPKCGSALLPNAKFCPKCGYSLSSIPAPEPMTEPAPEPAPVAPARSAPRRPFPVKTVLAFLPASLLLLLSVLLWAFFAAPAAKVSILITTLDENLYLLAGDQLFEGAQDTIYTLYTAAASGILVAIIALRRSGHDRRLPAVLSTLFCIVDMVLGVVLTAKIRATGADAGACPILILVFSILFGIASVVAGVLYHCATTARSHARSALHRKFQLKTLVAFLPATLLLLLSALLWAFFAMPAAKVSILGTTFGENLYRLAEDQLFEGAQATAYALYAAAGIGMIVAMLTLAASGPGRKLPAVVSTLFCFVDMVLGAVLTAETQEIGIGACPILILVFSILFGLVSFAAGLVNDRITLGDAILWKKLRGWYIRNTRANPEGFSAAIVFAIIFLILVSVLIATIVKSHSEDVSTSTIIYLSIFSIIFLFASIIGYFKTPTTRFDPSDHSNEDHELTDDEDFEFPENDENFEPPENDENHEPPEA